MIQYLDAIIALLAVGSFRRPEDFAGVAVVGTFLEEWVVRMGLLQDGSSRDDSRVGNGRKDQGGNGGQVEHKRYNWEDWVNNPEFRPNDDQVGKSEVDCNPSKTIRLSGLEGEDLMVPPNQHLVPA
jgi:hypothetical protein